MAQEFSVEERSAACGPASYQQSWAQRRFSPFRVKNRPLECLLFPFPLRRHRIGPVDRTKMVLYPDISK
jgi:hypothetical protein